MAVVNLESWFHLTKKNIVLASYLYVDVDRFLDFLEGQDPQCEQLLHTDWAIEQGVLCLRGLTSHVGDALLACQ